MTMLTRLGGVLMLATFGALAAESHGGHAPHWSYAGPSSPGHWSALDPGFAACGTGRNQSPLDLRGFIEADLPAIGFSYVPGTAEVVDTGHAVQVNFAPGSAIQLDGKRFELKQVHFHLPSENTLQGKSYPMEAHFVHADAAGELAVVALLFEEGAGNASLASITSRLPRKPGATASPGGRLSANDLLPAARDYYRYEGSLTTPPCSEGVRWLVMKRPAHASRAEMDAIRAVVGHDNNRPVQDVGARVLLQ